MAQGVTARASVVYVVPTRGNEKLNIFCFLALVTRQSKLNSRKVVNKTVLIGTECSNTSFPGYKKIYFPT